MKTVMITCLLLIGCTRAPDQREIDAAAQAQTNRRNNCEIIANSLNTKGKIQRNSDGGFTGWYECVLDYPKSKTYPWIHLSDDEMDAIVRYISIKGKK